MEKYSEGKIHKGEVEPRNGKLCKYCLLHSSGIILESVARSLFTLTINEQTIANVCYVCAASSREECMLNILLQISYYAQTFAVNVRTFSTKFEGEKL